MATINKDDINYLIEVLLWYKFEINSIHENLVLNNLNAVEASVTLLSLDNGIKAEKAIEILENLSKPKQKSITTLEEFIEHKRNTSIKDTFINNYGPSKDK